MNDINKLELDTDTDHEDMLDYFKAKTMNEMTVYQLVECKAILEKKLKKGGKTDE